MPHVFSTGVSTGVSGALTRKWIEEKFVWSAEKQLICLICSPEQELNKNPVEGFSAGLVDDDNIYRWEVVVIGPQDTLL